MEIIFDMHLMSAHNLKDNLVLESVETLNLRMGKRFHRLIYKDIVFSILRHLSVK